MKINSVFPSFNSGNAATMLSGLNMDDAGITYYSTPGTNDNNIALQSDGSVYVWNGADWVFDSYYSGAVKAVEQAVPGAVAVAQENGSGFSIDSLIKTFSDFATTAITAKAQSDLLKANLERAKKGLPPLNAQNYMPGVNVGLDGGTKQMVYLLGGGLAAVVLFGMLKKR